MTRAQLSMELDMKVIPAAGAFVESLRVANLVAREDVPQGAANEVDAIHVEAIALGERLTTLRRVLERQAREEAAADG